MEPKQTCKECGLTKPQSSFHKHAGMATGFYSTCKICMYTDQAARRQSEAKKRREPNEISVLMTKWGRA